MGETPTFMRLGVLLVPDFCTEDNLRLVRQCGATDIVLTCPGFALEELEQAVARIHSCGLKVDVIERCACQRHRMTSIERACTRA